MTDLKTAAKLALEALENIRAWPETREALHQTQAITALRQALANEALDKMAENAREIGLDYEPAAGTQVSKVWWGGEKLMAKQVPLEDFYKPAQQEPVAWVDAVMEQAQVFAFAWSLVGGRFDFGDGLETAEQEKAALRAMLTRHGIGEKK